MPKPSNNEAVVIVFDVGKTVSTSKNDEESFFTSAKKCLSLIIERKIQSNSQDELSLILMGADISESTSEDYENICCKFKLQPASFDMLRFVNTELKPTNNKTDWVDALIVAMEILRNAYIEKQRIVIISDFSYDLSDSELSIVTQNLKQMNINLAVIGPDHFRNVMLHGEEPSAKKLKLDESWTGDQKASYQLMQDMKNIFGPAMQVCTFEVALKQLTINPPPEVRRSPWNCILDIGDIQIEVSGLVKVKTQSKHMKLGAKPSDRSNEQEETNSSTMSSKLTPVARDREMSYSISDSTGAVSHKVPVRPEDVVEGHRYGTTIVPISEADKEELKFCCGAKGLSVIGFTDLRQFNPAYLIGEGCHVIVPRDNDSNSQVALSALVQAMHEMKMGAIARKVYAQDRGLSMVILTPIVEDFQDEYGDTTEYRECLAMNELPFKEDLKLVEFPSLNEKLSDQQLSAIDSLIDNMDLMNAETDIEGNTCEAFDIASCREYNNRFYQYCLMQRGLDLELPEKVPEDILQSYALPESLKEINKKCVNVLKDLFPMKIVERVSNSKSPNKRTAVVENEVQQPQIDEQTMLNLNYPKPERCSSDPMSVNDVKTLFIEDCFPRARALGYVISRTWVPCDEKEQVLDCLENCIRDLRMFAIKENCKGYNEWISEFKETVDNVAELKQFMDTRVKGKLGLITVLENANQGVTVDEAERFSLNQDIIEIEHNSPSPILSQDLLMKFQPNLEVEEEDMLEDYF